MFYTWELQQCTTKEAETRHVDSSAKEPKSESFCQVHITTPITPNSALRCVPRPSSVQLGTALIRGKIQCFSAISGRHLPVQTMPSAEWEFQMLYTNRLEKYGYKTSLCHGSKDLVMKEYLPLYTLLCRC